jgi:hypothetical protein
VSSTYHSSQSSPAYIKGWLCVLSQYGLQKKGQTPTAAPKQNYYRFLPFARFLQGPPRCFPAREDRCLVRREPAVEQVFLLVLRAAFAIL